MIPLPPLWLVSLPLQPIHISQAGWRNVNRNGACCNPPLPPPLSMQPTMNAALQCYAELIAHLLAICIAGKPCRTATMFLAQSVLQLAGANALVLAV